MAGAHRNPAREERGSPATMAISGDNGGFSGDFSWSGTKRKTSASLPGRRASSLWPDVDWKKSSEKRTEVAAAMNARTALNGAEKKRRKKHMDEGGGLDQ